MFRKSKFIFLFLLIATFSFTQQIIPKAIQASVTDMQLDYLAPVENPYKVKRGIQSDYFSYNALYRNKKEKQEIFVILEEENTPDDLVAVPHVEFSRLITALTTNSMDFNIIVKFMRDDKLRSYNADWGAETNLILKSGISLYHKAKLVSFYKEGRGMVSLLYCYEYYSDFPQLLTFKELELEN